MSRFRVLTYILSFMLFTGSRSCLVPHTNKCSNNNPLPGARRVKFRLSTLRSGWSSSDQTTQVPKGKTELQRAQQGRSVPNLVMLSLVFNTIYKQDTGHGGMQFYMLRSTRSSRLDASECPLRNINTRSPQPFQIHCCVAARIAGACHAA